MPKRKKEPEEPENVERWMLTYLDMITLLMAFFCILFAFAQVDAVKFKQVAQSMNISFGSGGGGQNALTNYYGSGLSNMSDAALLKLRQNSEYQAMIKMLREYAARQGLSNKIKTQITERGLRVDFLESVLFQSGSAELSEKARALLDVTGAILLSNNYYIRVEGHTDNVPIHTERYQTNWQLSTDRATSVIMYWISKYPEKQKFLSASGYGEFHPIDSNSTPEGRAKNRRIEVYVLRSGSN
ncbi:MAG: flagellar motor protein MotB [Firmicutes bacterium]|nr:flagellar motor protein MotB [Bacillota bacterium]